MVVHMHLQKQWSVTYSQEILNYFLSGKMYLTKKKDNSNSFNDF